MKLGKAFEILVKQILIKIGFSEVKSDGLYIFDGAPGQMIQGLGEAHNADVLLEPPAQTPFYAPSRLLIECKDYKKKVGLNTIRSVLGLREDINHFNIVDKEELMGRRRMNREGIVYDSERFYYQVAIAAVNGYTVPAQKFAATYRIPLLEFDKMPFWKEFCDLIKNNNDFQNQQDSYSEDSDIQRTELELINLAKKIGEKMAVAITSSGQFLFLYLAEGNQINFSNRYSLHWRNQYLPWELHTAQCKYKFQLPENLMKAWLDNATTDLDMRREAILCKESFMSNMIVYYTHNSQRIIKMISIDREGLNKARIELGIN